MKALNCTAHTLTEEQVQELQSQWGISEIDNLSEVNPQLFERLINTPGDEGAVRNLALEFMNYLASTKYFYFIFPIGSPYFLFTFAQNIWRQPSLYGRFLFAHSERQSVEVKKEDGTVEKRSVFKHLKFMAI